MEGLGGPPLGYAFLKDLEPSFTLLDIPYA